MKKYQILLLVWFLLTILFSKVHAEAVNNILILNEIMPNPSESDSLYEWIEIKNISKNEISLKNWQLNGKYLPEETISPNELVLLVRDINSIKAKYNLKNKLIKTGFALPNTGGEIELKSNEYKDSFKYEKADEGLSFERLSGNCNIIKKFVNGNTIGKENSLCESNKAINYEEKLTITKICPNIKNNKDYLEIKNPTLSTISLLGWTLSDLKTKEVLNDILIQPQQTIQLHPTKVTLNNDGDTIKLIHPNNGYIIEFKYPKVKENECYPTQVKTQIALTLSSKSNNLPKIEVTNAIPIKNKLGIKLDLKIPKLFRILFNL